MVISHIIIAMFGPPLKLIFPFFKEMLCSKTIIIYKVHIAHWQANAYKTKDDSIFDNSYINKAMKVMLKIKLK